MNDRFRSLARPALASLALVALLALAGSAAATHLSGPTATYTLNNDFDEGTKVQVDHLVSGQLQLPPSAQPKQFPFIWIAVSGKGTAVKIDVNTGAVLGEYLTAPAGMATNPSRTSVDFNGNVWATNRDESSDLGGKLMGSVVHFGLKENAQCKDRNGNNVIDTSTGLGDVRPWTNAGGVDTDGGVATAADECIIHFVRTNARNDRHVSVTADNDVWVSGTGLAAFDLIDGDTGAILRAEPTRNCGGYGGLIDSHGVIWSSNPLLRWDTALPLTVANSSCYGHASYGLCLDSQGNIWNTEYGPWIRKFNAAGVLLGTFYHGANGAQGCAVDGNDHVWVAHSLGGSSVGHLKNDGTLIGSVPVGSGPTGVAVDTNGKVWVTNHNSQTAMRINPNAGPFNGTAQVGAVDFTTVNLGGVLYNYSDMTGGSLKFVRPRGGSWTIVHDSTVEDARWGKVGWTSTVPANTFLNVTVSTSPDGVAFSDPQVVANGACFSAPNGRFAKVRFDFTPNATGLATPILYDVSLSVLPMGASRARDVFAGIAEPVSLEYETVGVRRTDYGTGLERLVIADIPELGLYADALEERGSAAADCGASSASAATQVAEVRLLNGDLVIEGLVNEASVSWGSGGATVRNESLIARVTYQGQVLVQDPVREPMTFTFATPGNGEVYLALLEREREQTAYGAIFRENLVHLYVALPYGREEVIIGSVEVQAGLQRFPWSIPRILPDDDARTGRDAPASTAGAIPLAVGVYDGSTPPGDLVDTYAVQVKHGEKVVGVLDPAVRAKLLGGHVSMSGLAPPLVNAPSLNGPDADMLALRLFDPSGAERAASTLGIGGAPQRVELNADLTGTWNLQVARRSAQAQEAWNYTLGVTVTPLLLLPQADALSNADAPDSCGAANAPLVSTGAWVGVLRDSDRLDVYKFQANIGELVAASLKPGEDADGVDMALVLWDRNCNVLDSSSTALAGLKGTPELVQRIPALYSGTYYLGVVRVNGVGNHYLSLAVVNPLPTLPMNDALTGADAGSSASSPTAITPATPVFQGRLDDNDAGDAYRFPLQADKRAAVLFTLSAGSSATVRLLDPVGNPVGQTTVLAGNTVAFDFEPAAAGVYALEVIAGYGGGNYAVAWAQAPVTVPL